MHFKQSTTPLLSKDTSMLLFVLWATVKIKVPVHPWIVYTGCYLTKNLWLKFKKKMLSITLEHINMCYVFGRLTCVWTKWCIFREKSCYGNCMYYIPIHDLYTIQAQNTKGRIENSVSCFHRVYRIKIPYHTSAMCNQQKAFSVKFSVNQLFLDLH